MFARPFRQVLWRSVVYTILLLIAVWFILESVFSTLLLPFLGPWPWLSTAIVWLLGTGMAVGAIFLIAPVSAIFAGLFLDDVAQVIEENNYSHDGPGTALPTVQAISQALKFTLFVIIANLIALLLVLLPGINFAIFFFLNGYLLGREYFQFAAQRFRTWEEAKKLRSDNELTIFLGGLLIAGFMSVPLLNLATPVFAAALMVHLHKAISGSLPTPPAVPAMQRAA